MKRTTKRSKLNEDIKDAESKIKDKESEAREAKLNISVANCVSYFKPPLQIGVADWADRFRRLSTDNSAEPGRWRTARTPYLKEIMDAFTDPRIHREVIVASSQVGKTECELNMMAYAIDIDPGPMMFVFPRDADAEDFSKRRVAPMIRDTARLRKKVAAAKGRDSNNTVLKKSYPGGMLTMTGSNSPSDLASVPARYVFGDERDRWAKSAGSEGDPWDLLKARTTTFYNYKMVEVSTPTIKGDSAIVSSFELGTREYWEVACPACGEYNFVTFDNIIFEHSRENIAGKPHFTVHKAEYCCPHCGVISSESEIKNAPHKWIAKNPAAIENGIRSFWINAFSSPWMAWKEIVLEFLQAGDDPQKLQVVFNTKFGQLWENRACKADEESLMERREIYEAELPDEVLCLTCGFDTQDNRLEYEVIGHGRYGETWGIEKGIIMGKPDEQDVWERVDGVLDHVYRYKDGQGLKISITFIDSGGHYTQEVYEECRRRLRKRVFAIKGKGGEGVPYTAPPGKGKIVDENGDIKAQCWLYTIGVDSGKERIMASLEVQEPGAKYAHFPIDEEKGYDFNYFSGLLSEVMVRSKKTGRWMWEKLPGHRRNEALDCRNYAMAAFRVLNPAMDKLYQEHKKTPEEREKQRKRQAEVQKKKRKKVIKRDKNEDW